MFEFGVAVMRAKYEYDSKILLSLINYLYTFVLMRKPKNMDKV